MAVAPEFINAHRFYVKSLYKRYLVNSLNWTISRDIWREKAIEIRAEFERNRNITDPRALAIVLEQAEKRLADEQHPDPYKVPTGPDGTKWERNLPPPPNAFFAKHHHEPKPVVDIDELLQNKWANLRQIAEASKGKKFTEPGSEEAAEPPKAPQ